MKILTRQSPNILVIWHIFLAVAAMSFFKLAQAGEFEFSSWDEEGGKGCLIKFSGEIVPSDVHSFGKYVARVDNCIVSNRQLEITSTGGDLLAALAIGKLVRSHLIQTSTWGVCASSCVFILAGGVRRFPMVTLLGGIDGPAKIAIHRPFSSKTDKDYDTLSKGFNQMAIGAKSFLREGGVSEKLWDDMVRIPAENMKVLSAQEAYDYGLLGNDPAFDDYLDNLGAKKYALSKEQYLERKRLVPLICTEKYALEDRTGKKLLKCKESVFRTGAY